MAHGGGKRVAGHAAGDVVQQLPVSQAASHCRPGPPGDRAGEQIDVEQKNAVFLNDPV